MADVQMAMAWFPAGEFKAALEAWPGFIEWEPRDHAEYCARVEADLRRYGAHQPISVAPITVNEFVRWSQDHDLDPGEPETRANYAAEVARRGDTIPWPPRRNETCWCGSGQKYKWCCGRAST